MLAIAAVIIGIVLLVFSADKFVDGAAAAAKRAGLPPLLIGMLVIGFGSSMPEMVISGLSASQGNSGLALGNAFGSNITNIALILGLTAAISPIRVESSILRRELPLLAFVTLTAAALLYVDGALSRTDGWILIGLFVVIMAWSIRAGVNNKTDHLAVMVEQELQAPMSMARAITYVVFGLILLVISSQILVWGGVEIARALGISDLIIGLTVVAVGTSLPELAASIAAVRKNEHDLALGNIIGSNLFNTSIVIGITGNPGSGKSTLVDALIAHMREAGLRVDVYPEPGKFKRQFQYAEEIGARFFLVVGDDEVASGTVTVKELATREQERLPRADVAERLRR